MFIDLNVYPLESAEKSNMKHRPVALGIQGLADVFVGMRVAFDSPKAAEVNRNICETMYFAALTESNELAKKDGAYESFNGSPLSKGIFHFELWKKDFENTLDSDGYNPKMNWNWELLRSNIMLHGVRNSLTIAHMPTASTAQILGNIESFMPYFRCYNCSKCEFR